MQDTHTILHIGAHRTGTTSLQLFLKKNQDILRESDIAISVPPETRPFHNFSFPTGTKFKLLSEENLLGTMEENIECGALYPFVRERVYKNESTFLEADKILISVRALDDYWNSVVSFCVGRGMKFPDKEQVRMLASSQRNWLDVVKDIRSIVPKAQLVVREFDFLKDNPKQQLLKMTGWQQFKATSGMKSINNARPNLNDLISKLYGVGDFASLNHFDTAGHLELFSDEEVVRFKRAFEDDLTQLGKLPLVTVHKNSERQAAKRRSSNAVLLQGKTQAEPMVCFLQIGRTGSDLFKSVLQKSAIPAAGVYLGGHGDTAETTLAKFGNRRKIGFFFRHPEERFVSSFWSRLKQGRPAYNVSWSVGEAVSFQFFETPNALAEALSSSNERLKSAAVFAFDQIVHMKLNYVHYLHSVDALKYEFTTKRIAFCCDTGRIERNTHVILDALRYSDFSWPDEDGPLSYEVEEINGLSDLAKSNLRKHWKKDFAIYEECRRIEENTARVS